MKLRFLLASLIAICLLVFPNIEAADTDDALHNAAKKGDTTQLEALLRGGANADSADEKGRTALIEAAAEGQTQAVRLLLQSGAKPDIQDKEGFTALMVAARQGRTEVVRLLLSRGADVKVKSDIGFDALCLASQERRIWKKNRAMPKHPETIQVLLDAGALPSATLCFIDPDYLTKAPRSFAILPVQDLRTADEKKAALELPAKLAEGLAKELKARKYEILPAVETQKKLPAADSANPEQSVETSAACSSIGTDAILQVQLLASKKRTYGIVDLSGMAVASSLTDCKSGHVLWRDWDIYTEHRGFILARFVSGTRIIASGIATKLPLRPKK